MQGISASKRQKASKEPSPSPLLSPLLCLSDSFTEIQIGQSITPLFFLLFPMDNIPEKLLKFKFPILIVTVLGLLVAFFIYLAPSFIDVIKYFWPLLVSTALFLAAIVVFGQISSTHAEVSGEKPGVGILDYVAGQPDNLQPQVDDDEEHEAAEVALQAEAAAAAASAAKAKGKAQREDE